MRARVRAFTIRVGEDPQTSCAHARPAVKPSLIRVGGPCGPPPPVAAPLAGSLRAPSRGDPPLRGRGTSCHPPGTLRHVGSRFGSGRLAFGILKGRMVRLCGLLVVFLTLTLPGQAWALQEVGAALLFAGVRCPGCRARWDCLSRVLGRRGAMPWSGRARCRRARSDRRLVRSPRRRRTRGRRRSTSPPFVADVASPALAAGGHSALRCGRRRAGAAWPSGT